MATATKKETPAPARRVPVVDPHRLTIQMPGNIRTALIKQAERNGRSLGGEAVFRLRESLGIKEPAKNPRLKKG